MLFRSSITRFVVIALAGVASLAWAASPTPRARPPKADWPSSVTDDFFPDAFSTLEGPRPNFAAEKTDGSSPPDEGEAPPEASGFKWSALVSEETLLDEIKAMKQSVGKAIASPSTFKGGGFNDARLSFSSIALCFGVIAAYDTDIRWKKQAVAARDLFARVANNCKAGSSQSFAESKLRMADLETLLEGSAITSTIPPANAFSWSQVAARPPLMSRLEAAEQAAAATIASKDAFLKDLDLLAREAEVIAMIGEVIQQKDHEFFDDETYCGFATTMRDAGVKAAAAARKKDYEAARAALGEVRKSCSDCHGGYRG